MKSCCDNKSSDLECLHNRHLGVLKIVLAINLVMFVVGLVSGIIARSTALSADSLDMLGDATVYAFSIYAIHKGDLWKIKAARLKGFIMVLFGLGILVQASRTFVAGTVPIFETMGIVGGLALCANLICLILLWRHRSDDVNMRSTWACSRNDIIANLSVLGASLLVKITHSGMPDLIVGVSISILFIASAISVFRDARAASERRTMEAVS